METAFRDRPEGGQRLLKLMLNQRRSELDVEMERERGGEGGRKEGERRETKRRKRIRRKEDEKEGKEGE